MEKQNGSYMAAIFHVANKVVGECKFLYTQSTNGILIELCERA